MLRRAAIWPLLVCCWCASLHATADRSESFIGYSEREAECEDVLLDCLPRARNNGCIYDPFNLRRFCPTTCAIERCSYHGLARIKHRGRATAEGTLAYSQLISAQYQVPKDYFRMVQIKPGDEQLMLSGIGIGTYLGDADARTDEAVVNAILFTVSHGWNVIDTASNYRWGRAEASVGTALSVMLAGDTAASFSHQATMSPSQLTLQNRLASALAGDPDVDTATQLGAAASTAVHQGGDITRDMVFVSTKAGFTTPDLANDLIKEGAMSFSDVVEGMHSMHPRYIKASLEQSLDRLHLETVDLFYLHNAAEVQLPAVGRKMFLARLQAAFQACEDLRADGKIVAYGLATWDCFRKPPSDPVHLSLAQVVDMAERVGGATHGFRFVQLPVNVAMAESWMEPWQEVQGRNVTFMEAAQQLHVGVMTSGPLGEAGLIQSMAEHVGQAQELAAYTSTASKLLQYARSVPGAITTLVGQKSQSNVESNVQLSMRRPLDPAHLKSAHHAITESRIRARLQAAHRTG